MQHLVVLAICGAATLLLTVLPLDRAAPTRRPIVDLAPWIFF